MSKEAMKLALEALENWLEFDPENFGEADKKAITALREALAEQPAQQALDKMAENARELGIQMQPEEPRAWFTVDELNAWADKKLKENPQWAEQPAQQEPVAWVCYGAPGKRDIDFEEADINGLPIGTLLYTFPPQRTWVGLTDEEITDIWAEASPYYHEDDFARAIEAKLKEKNT